MYPAMRRVQLFHEEAITSDEIARILEDGTDGNGGFMDSLLDTLFPNVRVCIDPHP